MVSVRPMHDASVYVCVCVYECRSVAVYFWNFHFISIGFPIGHGSKCKMYMYIKLLRVTIWTHTLDICVGTFERLPACSFAVTF